MPQYGDMDTKLAGLKYGIGESRDESKVVCDPDGIEFGKAVFGYVGDDEGAYNQKNSLSTGVFSADLVTANLINGNINGVAIAEVAFDTDHGTTMANLLAEVLLNPEVDYAELSDIAGDNRTISILSKGTAIVVAFTVTGGASQATFVSTPSQDPELVYLGAARREMKEYAGVARYELEDSLNLMTQGSLYVEAGEAVESNTKAYVLPDGTYGNSGIETQGVFKETIPGSGLVRLFVGGERG